MGRRLQRGRAGLRLDGQRLPERLPADPQPLLRGGPRLVAVRSSRASRRRTSSIPVTEQGPAGRLSRRVHRRGRPCPLHRPDLSAAVLEPDRVRRRADRAPGRDVHARPQGERRRRLLRLEPAGQRRRVDLADRGRGRPRRQRLGDRLVQLHRPAQPDAARASRPAGATPTRRRCATRPTGGSTGSSTRTRRPSTPPTLDPADAERAWSPRSANDNQFWRMHAQRLLVERGKTDVVPALIERLRDRSVDAIGLNVGAIHALWTLHGLGALDGSNRRGDRGGRRGAQASVGGRPAQCRRRSCRGAIDRPARSLSAGSADRPGPAGPPGGAPGLADQPPSDDAAGEPLVADALRRGLAADDRWLADAATAAAARNDLAFLKAMAARRRQACRRPRCCAIVERVAEHWARGGPVDEVGGLLAVAPRRRRRPSTRRCSGAWPAAGPRTGRRELDARPARRAQAAGDRAARRRPRPARPAGRARGATRPSTASTPRSPRRCWRRPSDESLAESRRIDAARQLVELRSAERRDRARAARPDHAPRRRPSWPPA